MHHKWINPKILTRAVKKSIMIGMLAVSAISLSSCGSIQEISGDRLPSKTASPINPITIIAENTATPEPEIIIRDPVHSHSPMRIQTDVPAGVEIPSFYHSVDLPGINHIVFAYTDYYGVCQFRVYAQVDELEDEVVMNTLSGFFNAQIYPAGDGTFIVQTNKEDNPLNMAGEIPAIYRACSPPTKTNIKNYIRKASRAANTYKNEVEKAEKNGEPIPEPTPWDGLPILTEDTEEIVIPRHIKQYKKQLGLYYYTNIYGDLEFRQYATWSGLTGAFYYSDENGYVKDGSLPLNTEEDFKRENAKSGKAQEPPLDRTVRIPILITATDNTVHPVFEVYFN